MASAHKEISAKDEWVTLPRAAQLLGETRLAVMTKIISKELDGGHFAGRTLVRRESLDALLAARDGAVTA